MIVNFLGFAFALIVVLSTIVAFVEEARCKCRRSSRTARKTVVAACPVHGHQAEEEELPSWLPRS